MRPRDDAPADALAAANAAQGLAADPRASVFVTANAGSGKTKVLIDRIARLLLAGSAPAAFLCITYTKAAAAEMQRRLFERLGAWCVADDATLARELTELGAPPVTPGDLGIARALFARALETPGGLRIQTIHAFCERLLARFPLEAGVAPGFDIADEARAGALLAMARAHVVLSPKDGEGGGEGAAFTRFAARLHAEGLEALLDRLVLKRADFRRYAEAHRGREAACAALRARHGAVADAGAFVRAELERAPWGEIARAIGPLSASSPQDQALAARMREAVAARETGEPRAALEALAGIVCNKDGGISKKLVTKKLAEQQPWLETVVDDLVDRAQRLIGQLNAIDRADDAEAALTLALALDGAYEAVKKRYGALDFDDLITHAQALLSRSDAAPWVLYKLDGGVDHILIDEGQDTSPGQWDLIAPLQDEFFAGAGARGDARTVFAVGDPKQSIYAFQGADPERFLREAQTLAGRAHEANRKFTAPTLETSFRSAPEVLSVVDTVFAGRDLAPAAPEQFNETRHLAARAGETGLVEVWPLALRPLRPESGPWDAPLDIERESTAPAQLAKAIAATVKRWIEAREGVWEKGALRAMKAGDVLALVRTRGALFHELIKAFKRAGLPVAGADRMTLKDELAVEDCLALMRVALDPADDLSLACVLKGPWCNLDDDDADIFPLAHGRAPGETLLARLTAHSDAKYARARAFVAQLAERAGSDAFEFLSWALETPDEDGRSGWARIFARLGEQARDPLEELLARALRPSPYAAPTLQRFLSNIENDAAQVKREMEAGGGAVRVMTVHGAKGLEAPVVILPDCTGAVADRAEDGLMFSPEGPFVSAAERLDDAATAAARAQHKARAMGEHLRLFYVAMTRARDRLVVCGAQYGGGAGGEADESWRLMAEAALHGLGAEKCETPFGEGLRLGRALISETRATAPGRVTTLPAWARKPVRALTEIGVAEPSRARRSEPAAFSPRAEGETRFRRGKLIHGLLQRLPEVEPARRAEAARAWLTRQRADETEIEALAREALAVIATPGFASVFGPASRAEIPIVGEAAGRPVRGVIDRLALEADGVLVLDYKTDRPAPKTVEETAPAYVLQMALYRAVIRKIFPAKEVRCALLWTEAPRLMELPAAAMELELNRFGSTESAW